MTNENEVLGEQINELFDELDTTGINYSDWEEGFIKDMKDKWDHGTSFSTKQVENIERLYSKYIAGDGEDNVEDTYDRFNH